MRTFNSMPVFHPHFFLFCFLSFCFFLFRPIFPPPCDLRPHFFYHTTGSSPVILPCQPLPDSFFPAALGYFFSVFLLPLHLLPLSIIIHTRKYVLRKLTPLQTPASISNRYKPPLYAIIDSLLCSSLVAVGDAETQPR